MTMPLDSARETYELMPGEGSSSDTRSLSLLLLGFDNTTSDRVIAMLRSAHILLRTETISTTQDLSQQLSKRLWDAILCVDNLENHALIKQTATLLHTLERDLPIIALGDNISTESRLDATQNGIAVLLPLPPDELLVEQLLMEAEALNVRRQLRQLHISHENLEINYHKLIEYTDTPCCYVNEQTVLHATSPFYRLLGLEDKTPLTLSRFLSVDQRSHLQPFLESPQTCDIYTDITLHTQEQDKLEARMHIVPGSWQGQPCSIMLFMLSSTEPAISADEDSQLPNRIALLDDLNHQLMAALTGGHDSHLLYIYLDDLIRYSRTARQPLLRELIRQIKPILGNARPYRANDDAIAVVLPSDSGSDAKQLAVDITGAISKVSVNLAGEIIATHSHISIYRLHDSSPGGYQILMRARNAIDRSTDKTPPYQFCHSQANRHRQQQYTDQLEPMLKAIDKGHVSLLFQPIIGLEDEHQNPYYEVFIHLLDEHGKVLPPTRFLSALEGSNQLLARLDSSIIKHAVRILARELRHGRHNHLFINLCGESLMSQELRDTITRQLDQPKIMPNQLIFQISETDVALWMEETANFIEFCHSLGVRVCIKHFSSSSSTARILSALDADFIKLDGSRVKELQDNIITTAELKELLAPVRDREIPVIAPLVESTRIISQLFLAGVSLIQGYYIQQPAPKMDYNSFTPH